MNLQSKVIPTIILCIWMIVTAIWAFDLLVLPSVFAIVSTLCLLLNIKCKNLTKKMRVTKINIYIIVFVGVGIYVQYVNNARNAMRDQVRNSIENYYVEHDAYPDQSWFRTQKNNDKNLYREFHYFPQKDYKDYFLLHRTTGYFEWEYSPESKEWVFNPN